MKENPLCSDWNVWHGLEIEGYASLGERTLFIRDPKGFFPSDLKYRVPGIERIWICADFWREASPEKDRFVWECFNWFREVCLELNAETADKIPHPLLQQAKVYYKVALPLKNGDCISVGPPFRDEAFEIGTGRKVCPEMYGKDEKIL